MAELNEKVTELEGKLEKARTMYKEQKAELDKANARIAELEGAGSVPSDNSSLLERIKELEDEIAINGNSSEEIKNLNTRLDKAKQIFAEQKEKIANLTTELNNAQSDCRRIIGEREELSAILKQVAVLVNR